MATKKKTKSAAKRTTKRATKRPAARKKAARKAVTTRGKYVYFFGGKKSDGDGSQKTLLGGKGANLAEMCNIGLPVPAGFTISTEVCTYYYDHKKTYPETLDGQIKANIAKIEKAMGKKFGDLKNPLLLSVRSGARESMPGMMDTVLNLGINDKIVEALAKKTKNPKFAWDSYRRFLQMYGSVVMGVKAHEGEHPDPYEVILDKAKAKAKVADDSGLEEADLRWVIAKFKKLIKKRSRKAFPENPMDQLYGSVNAVFNSWNNDRAKVYRAKYGIPAEWGTAVNVQAMVFGNTGKASGTGVAFTRDPATGENIFYGEYLIDAQGEDVVAGVRRTPKPLAKMAKNLRSRTRNSSKFSRSLRNTSAMCRTSSSPSKKASSGCSRPVTASAPVSRPSTSLSTWSKSASSAGKKRSFASRPTT